MLRRRKKIYGLEVQRESVEREWMKRTRTKINVTNGGTPTQNRYTDLAFATRYIPSDSIFIAKIHFTRRIIIKTGCIEATKFSSLSSFSKFRRAIIVARSRYHE